MFDGVPDQFHQFISSSSSSSTTLPFPPPHHASSTLSPHFDPLYTPNSHPFFLHQKITQEKDVGVGGTTTALNMEIHQKSSIDHHPWSSEEVLALLRVRSSLENWFPEFTWEHVSRKLADLGFQRSAGKCKEKFDEESKHFNNCTKNLRIFSELEELCNGDHQNNLPPPPEAENIKIISLENPNINDADKDESGNQMSGTSAAVAFMRESFVSHNGPCGLVDSAEGVRMQEDPDSKTKKYCNEKEIDSGGDKELAKSKKRRRENKFQIFKGFCENVVNKLFAQQEELHSKLLEDMVRRDEEKNVKEEAWKKQEMDRMNKELQLRAKEQAIAGKKQSTLMEFLSKYVPNPNANLTTSSSSTMQLCSLLAQSQNTNTQTKMDQLLSSTMKSPSSLNEQNPNSSPLAPTTPNAPQNPNSLKTTPTSIKEDLGKRWPKDQVLALINLRCSLFDGTDQEKEGGLKAPLWERISQGMMESGYKRSAKRCKEKWENINKYFRKTKHNSKKRSIDSRTCPYFHQLSTLYNQGTLMASSEEKGNSPAVALFGSHSDSPAAQVPPCFDFQV